MSTRPLILVVDDNENILESLKTILGMNNFDVIAEMTAEGAFNTLKQLDRLPDLIISDIKLPEKSGIDFFREFSKHRAWTHIPFIFLTGLKSAQDIRDGKALGVDDYLTKPINREELLAVIEGKLKRKYITERITKEARKRFKNIHASQKSSVTKGKIEENTILFIIKWKDQIGPQLDEYYPKDTNISFSIQDVGEKLFQCSRFIYGSEKITEPEGLLINLSQIEQSSFLFFDSYPNPNQRSGKQELMVGVLSPHISYFNSKKLEQNLKRVSEEFKNTKLVNLESFWKRIVKILEKT